MASSWSSTPWVKSGPAWRKRRVPYILGGTYLHTVDIWAPKTPQDSSSSCTAEPPLLTREGPWVVYIHGGAWRDPLVDSSSFENTALELLGTNDCRIAGIASINYPLSRHPDHPSHTAPPRDSSLPIDEARTAKHPDHIVAVLSALDYLQNKVGIAHDYILSGHSCGATLSFQVVMSSSRWAQQAIPCLTIPKIRKPKVVIGLNGLYDLKRFIDDPPESHANLKPLYVDFTKGAFGEDEQLWKTVCPTDVSDWTAEWPEGRVVVVAQSKEDGLVPYSQTELLKENLAKFSKLNVVEVDAGGDHNDIWKTGKELALIMAEVVSGYT